MVTKLGTFRFKKSDNGEYSDVTCSQAAVEKDIKKQLSKMNTGDKVYMWIEKE